MSKNSADPRIQRTRDKLGDALIELIQQKPFDTITVQDVLDKAEVGRSTFYVHYRDKTDLLLSDVEEFFELISTMLSRRKEQSDRVAPVRELFAHVADVRPLYAAMVASGKVHDLLELGQGHFARAIQDRLTELPRAGGIDPRERAAMAHALAGSLFSLLSWWLDRDMPLTATEMDQLYHRMVWTGLT